MLFEEEEMSFKAKKYVPMDQAFVDRYYDEIDPAKRKEILDAEEETLTPEDKALLQLLFETRYSIGKNGAYVDRFLGEFLNLHMLVQHLDSMFGAKRNKKVVQTALKNLCLLENDTYSEDILSREMYNLALMYIKLSSRDKNYTTLVFGLGKVSDATTIARLKRDLYEIGTLVPEKTGFVQEAAVLSKAIETVDKLYL